MNFRRRWWVVGALLLLVLPWVLPISGQLVYVPGDAASVPALRFTFDPPVPEAGKPVLVSVTDTQPWSFVLLTVDGQPVTQVGDAVAGEGLWTWQWRFTVPQQPGYDLAFYHDCHTGCVERGRLAVGEEVGSGAADRLPTKLGVTFPNPERDWHGRSGWGVEVTYASQAEALYWGIDDLAARVALHQAQGLRVLARVDYDESQSVPPVGDYLALTEYLDYLRRLARDDRLEGIYGIIIGNEPNALSANGLSPESPVTPAWYARVFNGYGEEASRTDNAVQVIHAENPALRVLVAPVRGWSSDQDGERTYRRDVPWLNYMNTLVAFLDEATRAKAAAGIPMTAPDGFDVQAPGHPDVPEMAGHLRADEPRVDLRREAWDGAQAGFRIYRDWLEIINGYTTTRGLPVYIISTNTYDREAGVPPAQNYPPGWLTTAMEVIDAEPQVQALCWFLDDFPHDTQWDWFSLTRQPGLLVAAAEEFEALVRGGP